MRELDKAPWLPLDKPGRDSQDDVSISASLHIPSGFSPGDTLSNPCLTAFKGDNTLDEFGLVGPVQSLTTWQLVSNTPIKKLEPVSTNLEKTLSPALSMISSVNSGVIGSCGMLDDVLSRMPSLCPKGGSQHMLQDTLLVSPNPEVEEDFGEGLDPSGVDMKNLQASEVKLGNIVGLGSFGKVYAGWGRGVKVAVKVMSHAMSAGLEEMDAAEKEAVLSEQLEHPNLVHTYAIYRLAVSGQGQIQTNMRASTMELQTHLVMEFCNQGTLRAALDNNTFICPLKKRPNHLQLAQVALDIAEALLYMHSKDLVHRDLKSANIMLHRKSNDPDEPLVVKVADFGLSKVVPSDGSVMNSRVGTLTHTAPEVLQRHPLSKSTDVYAFGVVLWELYTSKHPYQNMRPFDVILAKSKGHTSDILSLPEHCPSTYVQLCWDCWAPVAERLDMEEVVDRLLRIVSECGVVAPSHRSLPMLSSGRSSNTRDGVKASRHSSSSSNKVSVNLIGMIKPSPRCSTASQAGGNLLTSNPNFTMEDKGDA